MSWALFLLLLVTGAVLLAALGRHRRIASERRRQASVERLEEGLWQLEVEVHEDGSWSSPAARAFRVSALPRHFFVDRDGRFIDVPPGNPQSLADAVRELLDE